MKHILIIALISSNIPLIYGETITHNRMRAKFDERVELMSIICHLANYPEYNMDMGGEYINEIDNYFSAYKNHQAVLMMDSLRRKNGLGFDSPMSFAKNLQKNSNKFSLINDTLVPERRWQSVDLEKATDLISNFYNDSDFSNFIELQKSFYDGICKIFDENVISKFNQDWYYKFYGIPPIDDFQVVIGFNNGGGNYGPSIEKTKDNREIYAIIGYALNEKGEPYYLSEPEMYLNTLVHEFNHSFVNPLVNNPKYHAEIEKAGNKLFTLSRKVMNRNAYSNWQSVINESIVKTVVLLYLMDNEIEKEKIRHNIIEEMSAGFYWMPETVKCLQYYTNNRDTFPTFDSFYPVIIEFFKNFSDNQT